MQIRLDGRVALVTGAGGVVGRASALRMASEGAHVVCADIRHENAEHTAELARNMGVRAIAICADVSDENSVRNTVQKTLEEFGHLDVLNNNAAALDPQTLGRDGDLVDMDVDVWDRTMAVNLRGVMLGCKWALPTMLAAGSGVIVNVTSRSGMLADSARSAYGSSKAGVDMFTKYVATMYGYANIRCNSVAPASIDSPQDRKRFSTADWQRRAAERLLPRAPRPEDIAAAIAFLCSDDAAAITGQVIVVDSGAGVHRADHAVRAWDTARAGLGAS